MRNKASYPIPEKRTNDLVIRVHGDGVLVLDRRTDTVHYLPAEVTRVWRACTGKATLRDVASAAGVDERIAASAVDQLIALDLLEVRAGMDRRKFLQRSGLIGAAAVALPVIETVAAPPAWASGSPIGTIEWSPFCNSETGQAGFTITLRGWAPNATYDVVVISAPASTSLPATTEGEGFATVGPADLGAPGAFTADTPVIVEVRFQGAVLKSQPETMPACTARVLRAYVANNASPFGVSVVNPATNTVVGARITVGSAPFGVAITPDGSRVYVTNGTSNTVSVINTATNTVTGPAIPVGARPVAVAISPDGSRAYVANFTSSSVSVIDTATNTVTATVGGGTPAVFASPFALAVSPDGTFVYVTNTGGSTLSRINTANNQVAAGVVTGLNAPAGVAFPPGDSSRAYVSNNGRAQVSVVNTGTNTVTTNINVGTGPESLVVTPDGSRVYVTNASSSTVSVISTANNAVTTIPAANFNRPEYLAVSPDGSFLYVSNTGGTTLSRINVPTAVTAGAVSGFNTPAGIAIGVVPQPSTAAGQAKRRSAHHHRRSEHRRAGHPGPNG